MFQTQEADVLITGGASGIGLALAKRFLQDGAQVLVTGRSEEKLDEIKKTYPGLLTFRSDLGLAEDRESLANHVRLTLPSLNVVINNGGIQRRIGHAEDDSPWKERQSEIDILLAGPIHLNSLLIPILLKGKQRDSMIVNVTSGGAYIPQPFAPLYSACKAALHSYTVTLRYALRNAPVQVVELIPPAVATGLAGKEKGHGVPVDEFCDTIYPQIIQGDQVEIGYGPTATDQFKSAQEPYRDYFQAFSSRFPTKPFSTGYTEMIQKTHIN